MAEQITLQNVSFEYMNGQERVHALKDISFSVQESEFVCILGPSGCGKTTLLNLLAGFLKPTSGEILLGGERINGQRHDRGVVFQDFAQLFPWRTACQNVEFGLEVRGTEKAQRKRTALEYLRLVGLEKFVNAYPHQLSGGMQQRVAIARSLAYNPSVLLMDEPFAALDAMTREEMQRLLAEIWQQTRKTVVYITHNVAEAVYLGDKVVVLAAHPGTVRAEIRLGLPRPRDPLSEDFIAAQREILSCLGSHERRTP